MGNNLWVTELFVSQRRAGFHFRDAQLEAHLRTVWEAARLAERVFGLRRAEELDLQRRSARDLLPFRRRVEQIEQRHRQFRVNIWAEHVQPIG